MSPVRRLLDDRHGVAVQRFAVAAGAIALASMIGARYLDFASRDRSSALYAYLGKTPRIDYTPTASIRGKAGQTVLDPCTGAAK
ncbi:MAG: hypothetical protein KGM42_07230 [Hyphomicrobiales bacterium]|nr:hypothetical protein [Hyphomicrobiales bacterium]